MADLKDSRAQSRLEKAARETGNAGLHYEVEAKAVREKIARLRALRMAKEKAGRNEVVGEEEVDEIDHKEVRQIDRGVRAASIAGRPTKRWVD